MPISMFIIIFNSNGWHQILFLAGTFWLVFFWRRNWKRSLMCRHFQWEWKQMLKRATRINENMLRFKSFKVSWVFLDDLFGWYISSASTCDEFISRSGSVKMTWYISMIVFWPQAGLCFAHKAEGQSMFFFFRWLLFCDSNRDSGRRFSKKQRRFLYLL